MSGNRANPITAELLEMEKKITQKLTRNLNEKEKDNLKVELILDGENNQNGKIKITIKDSDVVSRVLESTITNTWSFIAGKDTKKFFINDPITNVNFGQTKRLSVLPGMFDLTINISGDLQKLRDYCAQTHIASIPSPDPKKHTESFLEAFHNAMIVQSLNMQLAQARQLQSQQSSHSDSVFTPPQSDDEDYKGKEEKSDNENSPSFGRKS